VDGVSFTWRRGETLGLVGESGCGKSTTGLAVLRMQPVTAGRIVFEGEDITQQARRARSAAACRWCTRTRTARSNPRMKVRDMVGEPLQVHGMDKNRGEYQDRIASLLDRGPAA
jgi:oligopeptide transport system ATP-binding protein